MLDSCALLDLSSGRLKDRRALFLLEAACLARQAYVPAVVALEIAQKAWAGKLDLGAEPRRWFAEEIARFRLRPLSLRASVALAAYALPEPFHRDPADRLIVAAARRAGGRLLTCDGRILAYARAGHVEALGY